MTGTKTPFDPETAPCGKKSGGERLLDDDGYGLVIRDQLFDCGCARTTVLMILSAMVWRLVSHSGNSQPT